MKKEILGKWVFKNGSIVADSNCELIESIIENNLVEIDSSEDGWTKRFIDKDGKIWELIYPQSHLQGGGPPKLTTMDDE